MVLLPTTVVGSYSVPEWLERLKTEYYQRRISVQHLTEIHEVAIKAAVKDQELAGIDIVSDGELRRDNDVDYFLARIPGVHIPQHAKSDYFDYYDAEVSRPLPDGEQKSPGLGLADDFRFTRQLTDRPVKFSFTGPFSLSRRIRDSAYSGAGDLVRALARRLNAEARELAAAALTSCRSTSRSWPDTRSTSSSPSRRSISWWRACRLPGRCTSATATGTRALPGRGITTSCSRPCRPRGWTRSSSNSPARGWMTCS